MNQTQRQQAARLLQSFKSGKYVFGLHCMDRLNELLVPRGQRALAVVGGTGKPWGNALRDAITDAAARAGVKLLQPPMDGAKPNAPYEDVYRIAGAIHSQRPDLVIAAGGGSTIDAVKAAVVLASLGDVTGTPEPYFGVNKVTEHLQRTGRTPPTLVAVQVACGSAAHLTKYSNITDTQTQQKKLIIDEAVTPARALFDYSWSCSAPRQLTADGALDGFAHCLEVFLGSKGPLLDSVTPVATLGMELIAQHVRHACEDGSNVLAREALGLATDLGGYTIMLGGTSGPHLNSFSLVDLLPHGRACALLTPYYLVFFAPAVEPQMRRVAGILRDAGYLKTPTDHLHGRDLGLAAAGGMIELCRSIRFPTRLEDVEGFTSNHIARCLHAAKAPELESKLQNMPVPLTASMVDQYMGPVLEAAFSGDFRLIRNMA